MLGPGTPPAIITSLSVSVCGGPTHGEPFCERFVLERLGFCFNQIRFCHLPFLVSSTLLSFQGAEQQCPEGPPWRVWPSRALALGTGWGPTDFPLPCLLADKPGLLLPGLHPGRLPAHVHRKALPAPVRILPEGLGRDWSQREGVSGRGGWGSAAQHWVH